MIYGTTIFIGEHNVETKYGTFLAKTYQNLISSKMYIIAMCFGDIHSKQLYTRIHTSCVTSETLCGKDCDCVEQLFKALETIAKKGNGILFYIIQEGRGAGYVAKSRDRMIVQHSRDQITTFEAYNSMGLKNDHREYTNVLEICKLMGINPEWILLSNNPDKIKGMQELGMNVVRMEALEFQPNEFNMAYLRSKQKYGHLLEKVGEEVMFTLQKPPIEPFEPRVLDEIKRFVYCASYYLPVTYKNGTRWFRVYVYYDIATSNDYVILEYKESPEKTPYVRVHSETIFSRFPLVDDSYKKVYLESVEHIVENGYGYIGLFYQDGRGYGVGGYQLDQINNKNDNGIVHDVRDYWGITKLLCYHLDCDSIKLITNHTTKSQEYFEKMGIRIEELINVGEDILGHNLLEKRHKMSIDKMHQITMIKKEEMHLDKNKVIVTGIGSSSAHAQYFEWIGRKRGYNWSYVPIMAINDCMTDGTILVLFSQGLSPNAQILFKYMWMSVVLFTSCTEKWEIFDKCDYVVNYPLENEFGTLIRLVGPLIGFNAINHFMIEQGLFKKCPEEGFKKEYESLDWVVEYIDKRRPAIKIVFDSSELSKGSLCNLGYKFLEGIFYERTPEFCDVLEFSHGYYQNILKQFKNGKNDLVILLDNGSSEIMQVKRLLEGKCELWNIEGVTKKGRMVDFTYNIVYYEYVFNELIMRLIKLWKVNQKKWDGDDSSNALYQKKE